MLVNRIKWAVRRGEPIGQTFIHELSECRYLCPVDEGFEGAEITLQVPLYMSRSESADDLSIFDPNNGKLNTLAWLARKRQSDSHSNIHVDITKIATLEVKMTNPKNRYGYPLTDINHEGKKFWMVDSVVQTHLKGWTLTWEVIIPPKGDFALLCDAEAKRVYGEYRSGQQTCCVAAGFLIRCV